MKISLYLNEITKDPCVIGWCFSSVRVWRQANRIQRVSVVCNEQLSCWPAHESKGWLTSFLLPQQPSKEHCWFELGTWKGCSCKLWLEIIWLSCTSPNQNNLFSTPAKGLWLAFMSLFGQDKGRKMCSTADNPLLLWVRQALSTFVCLEHVRVCVGFCVTWVTSSGK